MCWRPLGSQGEGNPGLRPGGRGQARSSSLGLSGGGARARLETRGSTDPRIAQNLRTRDILSHQRQQGTLSTYSVLDTGPTRHRAITAPGQPPKRPPVSRGSRQCPQRRKSQAHKGPRGRREFTDVGPIPELLTQSAGGGPGPRPCHPRGLFALPRGNRGALTTLQAQCIPRHAVCLWLPRAQAVGMVPSPDRAREGKSRKSTRGCPGPSLGPALRTAVLLSCVSVGALMNRCVLEPVPGYAEPGLTQPERAAGAARSGPGAQSRKGSTVDHARVLFPQRREQNAQEDGGPAGAALPFPTKTDCF